MSSIVHHAKRIVAESPRLKIERYSFCIVFVKPAPLIPFGLCITINSFAWHVNRHRLIPATLAAWRQTCEATPKNRVPVRHKFSSIGVTDFDYDDGALSQEIGLPRDGSTPRLMCLFSNRSFACRSIGGSIPELRKNRSLVRYADTLSMRQCVCTWANFSCAA